jgi:tRNA(adenine34) deaminase
MNAPSFMDLALKAAEKAGKSGEVPIGCVIVRDGEVIAAAGNRTLTDRDPTAHAEVLAIRQAASALGQWRLEGCSMFVTLEPCAMCAGAIMHARIGRVVYGTTDPKSGACGSVVNLFAENRLNHHATVIGGVLAEEAARLLQDFFVARRPIQGHA